LKTALLASAFVALILGGLAASIWIASEAGDEIVVLRTFSEDGTPHETRVWIVDEAGIPWLRSGPTSSWLQRITREPSVELVRDGEVLRFRAIPVPGAAATARIHALMREKYGFADTWLSLIISRSASVAIRLEAPPGGGSLGTSLRVTTPSAS
jgi:hypothetical protein